MIPRTCGNCKYHGGKTWIGDVEHVVCPKLPGGKSAEVKVWRGCADFAPKGDKGEGAGQAALF